MTVTMDVREEFLAKGKPHELFYMSHKMIRSLSEFTKDVEEPVWIKSGSRYPVCRFACPWLSGEESVSLSQKNI